MGSWLWKVVSVRDQISSSKEEQSATLTAFFFHCRLVLPRVHVNAARLSRQDLQASAPMIIVKSDRPALIVTARMSIKPHWKCCFCFSKGIPHSKLCLWQRPGRPFPDCMSDSKDSDQLKLPLISNDIQLCCSWFCGFPLQTQPCPQMF